MLSKNQIDQWNNKGYVLVNNILNKNNVLNSSKFLKSVYNSPESILEDFGSDGKLEFPSNTILDKITLDENLIKCIQELLYSCYARAICKLIRK